MPAIPFTQFVRPDGRQQIISIERPDEVARKALAIIHRGFRFEAEVLTTGEVSLTIADTRREIDLDIEIAPNVHHGIGAAVDRLITRYFDKLNA